MKTTGGQIDLTGEICGTLEVLRPLRLRPRISYEIKCTQCGSVFAGLGNQELQNNPKCINAGCGKKYFKTWREEAEHELEETLHREEEQYKRNLTELARLKKEYVLKAERDDEFILSPETRDQKFTPAIPTFAAAIEYTRKEAEAFVSENGGYWACPQNAKTLTDYLIRQKAETMVSRQDFQRAYYRLREVGALLDRPAPEPEPEPTPVPEPEVKRLVNTKSLPVKGIDPLTGKEKFYTQREVDRMSSEQYLRAFFGTVDGLSDRYLNLIPVLQGRLRA